MTLAFLEPSSARRYPTRKPWSPHTAYMWGDLLQERRRSYDIGIRSKGQRSIVSLFA